MPSYYNGYKYCATTTGAQVLSQYHMNDDGKSQQGITFHYILLAVLTFIYLALAVIAVRGRAYHLSH